MILYFNINGLVPKQREVEVKQLGMDLTKFLHQLRQRGKVRLT